MNTPHGSRMKRLRQHRQRKTVLRAESHSAQQATVSDIASRAGRQTKSIRMQHASGEPITKTKPHALGLLKPK